MRKCITMLLLLATCCCTAQGKQPPQLVADPAIIPAFPPPPVDLATQLPAPELPQVKCLQATGWPVCQSQLGALYTTPALRNPPPPTAR
jgi:hypothetical protein